jgi:hypothetical protein
MLLKVEEVLSFHTLTGSGAVRPLSGTSQVFRNPEPPSDSRTTPEREVATGFFRVENLLDRTNVAPRARGLGFSFGNSSAYTETQDVGKE